MNVGFEQQVEGFKQAVLLVDNAGPRLALESLALALESRVSRREEICAAARDLRQIAKRLDGIVGDEEKVGELLVRDTARMPHCIFCRERCSGAIRTPAGNHVCAFCAGKHGIPFGGPVELPTR